MHADLWKSILYSRLRAEVYFPTTVQTTRGQDVQGKSSLNATVASQETTVPQEHYLTPSNCLCLELQHKHTFGLTSSPKFIGGCGELVQLGWGTDEQGNPLAPQKHPQDAPQETGLLCNQHLPVPNSHKVFWEIFVFQMTASVKPNLITLCRPFLYYTVTSIDYHVCLLLTLCTAEIETETQWSCEEASVKMPFCLGARITISLALRFLSPL